ncbi:Uncharacterized protein FWK35_00014649, partial [Aphis craccivora]
YLLLYAPHSVTVQPPDRSSAIAVTTTVRLKNSKKNRRIRRVYVYVSLSFCFFFNLITSLCFLRRLQLYLYDKFIRLSRLIVRDRNRRFCTCIIFSYIKTVPSLYPKLSVCARPVCSSTPEDAITGRRRLVAWIWTIGNTGNACRRRCLNSNSSSNNNYNNNNHTNNISNSNTSSSNTSSNNRFRPPPITLIRYIHHSQSFLRCNNYRLPYSCSGKYSDIYRYI